MDEVDQEKRTKNKKKWIGSNHYFHKRTSKDWCGTLNHMSTDAAIKLTLRKFNG